jgi:hypothetical protein
VHAKAGAFTGEGGNAHGFQRQRSWTEANSRKKIFKAALNLRVPSCDQGTSRIFFFDSSILTADFRRPHSDTTQAHFRRLLLMNAVIHFSTDEISPRHRLAVWREALFQSEFNVDIEPITEAPFRAQAKVRMLLGLRVLSGRSSPAIYQRNTRRVLRDEVVLSFGKEAHVSARQTGREARIETGDAFLLPCGDCASIHVPHEAQFTTVRGSRAQRSRAMSWTFTTRTAAASPATRPRSCC